MAELIRIANLSAFLADLERAKKKVSNLTEPLTEVRNDWMRTNRLLFENASPGQWADLNNDGPKSKLRGFGPAKTGEAKGLVGGYKRQKLKRFGFVYPVLRASGMFERSITVPGDSNSLFEMLNGTTLAMGTRAVSKSGAPYPYFLNQGTRFMPARRWAVLPQLSVARWKKILSDFVVEALQGSHPGGAVKA